MKTLLKIIVATIIGLNAGMVAIALNATDNVVFAAIITVDVVVAYALGVFDIPEETEKTDRPKTERQKGHILYSKSARDLSKTA